MRAGAWHVSQARCVVGGQVNRGCEPVMLPGGRHTGGKPQHVVDYGVCVFCQQVREVVAERGSWGVEHEEDGAT